MAPLSLARDNILYILYTIYYILYSIYYILLALYCRRRPFWQAWNCSKVTDSRNLLAGSIGFGDPHSSVARSATDSKSIVHIVYIDIYYIYYI